ncbi:MAG: LysM peptidoglycan-binding domain-containing M23 family metallopeptidase [Candidatus Omnitrophica bacterium]|nr:LysM peptidoglycan-binding domain-containing M23 family metallopeptidase [Candidatus Omnitrophota bacterium]
MQKNKIRNIFILAVISVFILSGCASISSVNTSSVQVNNLPGIYHNVVKGETLWKISKVYGVDLEELVKINHITDATSIEVGQKIFIPRRFKPQPQAVEYGDNGDFTWPLKGKVIATFGQQINYMLNKGINIQPYGSIDIVASRSGRVVFLGEDFVGFGKTIIIDHGDGLFTVYGRNSSVFVKAGDNVQKGAVISRAGYSGRDKNTYLHFEVRKGQVPQNPLFYLP